MACPHKKMPPKQANKPNAHEEDECKGVCKTKRVGDFGHVHVKSKTFLAPMTTVFRNFPVIVLECTSPVICKRWGELANTPDQTCQNVRDAW
mmetsp:Transcript_65827/g.116905  ORF Transcript_65827/g.116905 Transcript_65827/m.116905 type:complete len:92 (+) Transcript_65827:1196-1471(+)